MVSTSSSCLFSSLVAECGGFRAVLSSGEMMGGGGEGTTKTGIVGKTERHARTLWDLKPAQNLPTDKCPHDPTHNGHSSYRVAIAAQILRGRDGQRQRQAPRGKSQTPGCADADTKTHTRVRVQAPHG